MLRILGVNKRFQTLEDCNVRVRKKPVEVHAVRWTGKAACLHEVPGAYDALKGNPINVIDFSLPIHTLEGTMIAEVGDYIIRGVQGEFYPCKPGIFKSTYDFVGD